MAAAQFPKSEVVRDTDPAPVAADDERQAIVERGSRREASGAPDLVGCRVENMDTEASQVLGLQRVHLREDAGGHGGRAEMLRCQPQNVRGGALVVDEHIGVEEQPRG